MARAFTGDAGSQYLEGSFSSLSLPITLAAWVNVSSTGLEDAILWVGDADVSGNWYVISLGYFSATKFGIWHRADDNDGKDDSTTDVNTGNWQHVAGVFTSTVSRSLYVGGDSEVTNVDNQAECSIDTVSVARRGDSTPSAYLAASIAEAAIWNAALTDAEVAILAEGISPLLIRPDALVAYWPLLDSDNEWSRRYDMTPTNGPGWAGHPPQVVPVKRQLWKPARLNNTRQIWAMS